jgi:hypothetical protein
MAIVGFVMGWRQRVKSKRCSMSNVITPTLCLDGRTVELHARQEGAPPKSTCVLVSKRKEGWTMATIRNDETRGYVINRVGDVCNGCANYEEQDAATLNEILTDRISTMKSWLLFVTGGRKGFKRQGLTSAR